MKYIEKSRLEKFLNLKGYQVEPHSESIQEKYDFSSWVKSANEKINVPKRNIFQSTELSTILISQELLREFRKF